MKLSVQDRRKYVLELHKRGYTIREIAQELRMSSRDVVKILKENEREEIEAREREAKEKAKKEKERLFTSNRSEALKLYKKGTTPVDVAIRLGISAEEAKTIYHEYCSLKYHFKFLQLYTELNNTNSFNSFTDLFHIIREKGLSIEEGIEGIGLINDFSLLKGEYQNLINKISNLEKSRDFLIFDNNLLKVQNEEIEKRLNSILEKIDVKEKTLEIISKKVRQKEEELHKINSGENYYKAREKVKLLVEEILGNKTKVISLAVTSIITAVKEDHQKQIPIKDLSKSVYKNISDPEAISLSRKVKKI